MHGYIKFIMPKMTSCCTCQGQHFCHSLDFFRARFHAFFAKDDATEGDYRCYM